MVLLTQTGPSRTAGLVALTEAREVDLKSAKLSQAIVTAAREREFDRAHVPSWSPKVSRCASILARGSSLLNLNSDAHSCANAAGSLMLSESGLPAFSLRLSGCAGKAGAVRGGTCDTKPE